MCTCTYIHVYVLVTRVYIQYLYVYRILERYLGKICQLIASLSIKVGLETNINSHSFPCVCVCLCVCVCVCVCVYVCVCQVIMGTGVPTLLMWSYLELHTLRRMERMSIQKAEYSKQGWNIVSFPFLILHVCAHAYCTLRIHVYLHVCVCVCVCVCVQGGSYTSRNGSRRLENYQSIIGGACT